MNINNLLNYGRKYLLEKKVTDSQLKSRLLLSHVLGMEKIQLIINSLQEIDKDKISEYKNALKKLGNGMPIQYITNNQEFMKLNFYVDENVLIPQPDTEILVENAIKYLNNLINIDIEINQTKKYSVLDLCTGSGAIAVSIAKYVENCEITAVDISSKAIQIAKLNAERNLVHNKIQFVESDMFEKISDKKFDLIISNPPYIESSVISSLSKEVQSEPRIALDGGIDGLDFYRIIYENAYNFLNDSGAILVEIGYNQKQNILKILDNSTLFANIKCIKDLENNDRVIFAQKKPK